MRNPVEVIHESGRTTTVPRGTVKALARSGWRLVDDPEPARIEVTNLEDSERSFIDVHDSTGTAWDDPPAPDSPES